MDMDTTNKHQQITTEPQPLIHPQMAKLKEEEEDDDDPPTLSPYALEALQAFLASQSLSSNEQTQQQVDVEVEDDVMPLLSEDWRMSQFWYSPQTAITVAQEVHSLLPHFSHLDLPPSVACISCPTLFIYLKHDREAK